MVRPVMVPAGLNPTLLFLFLFLLWQTTHNINFTTVTISGHLHRHIIRPVGEQLSAGREASALSAPGPQTRKLTGGHTSQSEIQIHPLIHSLCCSPVSQTAWRVVLPRLPVPGPPGARPGLGPAGPVHSVGCSPVLAVASGFADSCPAPS